LLKKFADNRQNQKVCYNPASPVAEKGTLPVPGGAFSATKTAGTQARQ
jgi:hypothetical protein